MIDQPRFLWAVLDLLGAAARVALEGDLSESGVCDIAEARPTETEVLRRQTVSPLQDFVVLPARPRVVAELMRLLPTPGVFGAAGRLIHVQAELDGSRVFIACDNFHPECTFLDHPDAHRFLERLQAEGVVRSFAARSRAAADRRPRAPTDLW